MGTSIYKDRIKDMINRGGEKVFPREVEEVIVTHPAVKGSCRHRVPDERLGEEVKPSSCSTRDNRCRKRRSSLYAEKLAA